MFTGLVEETGILINKSRKGNGLTLTISAHHIFDDLKIGDSVNVDGVCQTVTSIKANTFTVDTVEETLKKTTLGHINMGDKVNLERSLTPSSRLGGHFVAGHVDCTGRISKLIKLSSSYEVYVEYPTEYDDNLIPVGSIAIDGISLTVAEKGTGFFKVAVIPHTWEVTCLKNKNTGSEVNLEFDLLGKYVLNIVKGGGKPGMTEEWLRKMGY
ncbi:MAG: riboflavin synthase [Ignavibacteriaceae bacterium]|nr:riboflavin synthase [Ignavibacteriaceae bacterium]NUM71640.1 riboflavin synthase [Ignavibacteriaceae bacterium]